MQLPWVSVTLIEIIYAWNLGHCLGTVSVKCSFPLISCWENFFPTHTVGSIENPPEAQSFWEPL